jgi:hypothetical protein
MVTTISVVVHRQKEKWIVRVHAEHPCMQVLPCATVLIHVVAPDNAKVSEVKACLLTLV